MPYLLPVLVWWFKPVYDRFYLHYLSRRIFGQEVTVKETWGQWRTSRLQGASFLILLIRRFSGTRSMTLAVSELENLKGPARGQRSSVVTRVGGGQAFLLTLGGLLLELLGVLNIGVLIMRLIPQGQNPGWDQMWLWLGEGGSTQTLFILGIGLGYGLLVLFLEPLYLASGFGLYLNSRTRQEAWDIELRFRELAARVAKTTVVATDSAQTPKEGLDLPPKKQSSKFKFASSKPVALLAFFLGLLMSSNLLAQEDPQVVVDKVLADDAFEYRVEKYKEWEPKDKNKRARESGPAAGAGLAGVDAIFMLVGYLALALLIVALVVLFVNLIKKSDLGVGPTEKKFKRPPPKVVLGMEVTPESLPDDILAQARLYWGQGKPKLALSLLYRGALTKLITEKEVAIEGSDTESECVEQVERATPGILSSYFKALSVQWMKAAYSREEVKGEDFEGLCAKWPFERRVG